MKRFLQILVFLFLATSINLNAQAQTKAVNSIRSAKMHLNLSESDYKQIVDKIFTSFLFRHVNYPENETNILLYFKNVSLKFKKIFLRKVKEISSFYTLRRTPENINGETKKVGDFYILKERELAKNNSELAFNFLGIEMEKPNLLFIWVGMKLPVRVAVESTNL